uniref:D-galactarate dehydratase n=1 Tax=Roseovarius halophilus (ex Wu et al. 2025) TaxID=3376060 RepID=UPI00399BCC5D
VAGAADAGARRLGRTIATLGSAAEPGIWIKTPLVDGVVEGRADNPSAGTSIAVELRPAGGDPGAGSQVSLAAMRLLEAPLTGLPELILFTR